MHGEVIWKCVYILFLTNGFICLLNSMDYKQLLSLFWGSNSSWVGQAFHWILLASLIILCFLSQVVLKSSCFSPSSWISHLSKEPWFLIMKSGRWKSRSGHQVCSLRLGLSAAAALVPSHWTQLGNVHTNMHTCMCVYAQRAVLCCA